jgi:hypothetical protein
LDDNSETNKKGGTRTHLNWTNTLNFKELRKYKNVSGPKHSLPVDSSEKDFFELFVTSDFYNKVAEETNKYATSSQTKGGKTQMRKNPSFYWNSDLYGPC